jgi:hypothetical protein
LSALLGKTDGGFFMSKRKSDSQAARSPSSPPEIVCVLAVDIILDEFEVENFALIS